MSPIVSVAVIRGNQCSAGLLSSEGAASLCRSALSQAHGLQGLSALDVIRKGPADLQDKSPPVLRVSQGASVQAPLDAYKESKRQAQV